MARLEQAGDTFGVGPKEYVKVTNISGTTWTVTRAQGGSSAAAWASGDKLRQVVTAETLTNMVQRSATWTSDPGVSGFILTLWSNYAPGTNAGEAVVFYSSASGTKRRVLWVNENNAFRCAASRVDEVPHKVHGYEGGGQTADLSQWLDKWGGSVLSGVHADGTFYAPNLGETIIVGLDGTLSITTGNRRWPNLTGKTLTITAMSLQLTGAGPVGADFIVDVNKNGTTIYSTQANRPKVTDGTSAPAYVTPTLPNDLDIAAGDYLTVDIDSVGTTTPAASFILIIKTKFKA